MYWILETGDWNRIEIGIGIGIEIGDWEMKNRNGESKSITSIERRERT